MEDKEKQAQLRQASERLYGDSRLREGLTDEQAEKLLAWGFNQLEREAEQAVTHTAAGATSAIEAQLKAVQSTLKLVSQMVRQLPEASDARSREYVGQLVDALCEVDTRTLQINDMLALEKLADRRSTLEPAEIAQHLLDIIRSPVTKEGERAPASTETSSVASAGPTENSALAIAPNAITDGTDTIGEEE